jgi:hypothetical protein
LKLTHIWHKYLKTLVVSALSEVQRPWDWLIQSLNNDPQPIKQKKAKGKKKVTQKQSITIDELPVKEEMFVTRMTRTSKRKKQTQQIPIDTPVDDIQERATTNKGKRSKLDAKIEMFPDADIKMK